MVECFHNNNPKTLSKDSVQLLEYVTVNSRQTILFSALMSEEN